MVSASKSNPQCLNIIDKFRSKSEAKVREKPFIPKLNLNLDYLELKCQERDLQEMRQLELQSQLLQQEDLNKEYLTLEQELI